ncbi:OmpL47-type beta-barrel domain-containing protein, partial [Streptomyces niphimycinicus]
MILGLGSATATAAHGQNDTRQAAQQTLTWTAGDDITKYASAPTTAVAGKTTIVFENSTATGNTMGMPHTLTFDVSDPEYNNDVPLNILANPSDDSGGKHTAEVTLSPGRYRYHCTIPGHGQMQGILVVTDGGGGEDTTAPDATAKVEGEKNADGAYIGMATVTVSATDEGSGVDRIEFAEGDAAFQPYTAPVMVHQVGQHTIRYRAV